MSERMTVVRKTTTKMAKTSSLFNLIDQARLQAGLFLLVLSCGKRYVNGPAEMAEPKLFRQNQLTLFGSAKPVNLAAIFNPDFFPTSRE